MATKQQDANQYIFQDGQWIKVGKTKLVIEQEPGPTPSSGSSKQIYLTKHVEHNYYVDYSGKKASVVDAPVLFCRLVFNGFTTEDVGKKIYLYRRRHNKGDHKKQITVDGVTSQVTVLNYKKDWKHPLNYTDAARSGKNIMGFGYGLVAGQELWGYTRPQLNVYQLANGHNGFIQTEWDLTADDINNKYKDINLSEMAIDLLLPDLEISNWSDSNLQCHLIGTPPVFKFGLVDGTGNLETISVEKWILHTAQAWSDDGGKAAKSFANINKIKFNNKYYVSAKTLSWYVLV